MSILVRTVPVVRQLVRRLAPTATTSPPRGLGARLLPCVALAWLVLAPPAAAAPTSSPVRVTTGVTTGETTGPTTGVSAAAVAAAAAAATAATGPRATVGDAVPDPIPAGAASGEGGGDDGSPVDANSPAEVDEAPALPARTTGRTAVESTTGTVTLPIVNAVAGVDPAMVEAFSRARKAMLDGQLDRFDQAVRPIPADHPLRRYVDYWRLRILLSERRPEGLGGQADDAVRAFLARYPGSLAADLLRRDWMLALGRREDWRGFNEQYRQWILKDETGPDCYAELAKVASGKPDRAAARALVLRPAALGRPCRSLLTRLAGDGLLTRAQLRERFFLALELNSPADIRDAANLIGLADQGAAVDDAIRNPARFLRRTKTHPDLLLIALVRQIRSDAGQGARQVETQASRLATPGDRAFVWSQLAAAGARRMMPEAHGWMLKAEEAVGAGQASAKASRSPRSTPVALPHGDETRRWLVRAALRQQDWARVASLVDGFSPAVRTEPEYRYWRGRAHAGLGQAARARAEFEGIAGRLDYYGKLAREELGQPIAILPRADTPTEAAPTADLASPQNAAQNSDLAIDWNGNESFQRARAFYDVGMRFEGNREWNFELRSLSAAQIRSSAWWAQEQGLLDRAINADERLGVDAVAELRFPTPHAEKLVPIARTQGIDPSWAYGLIRQESRFIPSARSTVGASGLMQLMPATARWVARQMGRQDYTGDQIDDLRTNIEFGTFYLRRVLDNVDGSPLLASAGYNAGPGRARAWRSSLAEPLEGAIFAELIPFTETRNYVKHVLSNTVDYAALASGKPQSLKQWLGQVSPGSSATLAMP